MIYFEKTKEESHINIFRRLEIENYFKQSLKKQQGFDLHTLKISFSNTRVHIFLSIYIPISDQTWDKKIRENEGIYKIRGRKYKKKQFNLLNRRPVREIPPMHKSNIKFNKKSITKQKWKNFWRNLPPIDNSNFRLHKKIMAEQTWRNYWKNSLKSLNQLTGAKYQINLKIRWLSEKSLKKRTKKSISGLEYKFRNTEIKRLYLALLKQKNTASLLGGFIAKSLKATKRHNSFLYSLIQSLTKIVNHKTSRIKGLKILLKGRLNNAPRSRNKIIKIGQIPILSQRISKDYSETVSYTSNGTIGIKVWINFSTKTKKTEIHTRLNHL